CHPLPRPRRLQPRAPPPTLPASNPESAMALTARDLENLIRAAFPDARIRVEGDDGVHFAAEVIDESFRGKNRVEQQRAVYAALQGRMDGDRGELHALALTTK